MLVIVVTAPIWMPAAIVLVFFIVLPLQCLIDWFNDMKADWNRR